MPPGIWDTPTSWGYHKLGVWESPKADASSLTLGTPGSHLADSLWIKKYLYTHQPLFLSLSGIYRVLGTDRLLDEEEDFLIKNAFVVWDDVRGQVGGEREGDENE